MADRLAESIQADVERLCVHGGRDLGTDANRLATEYVTERMRAVGLDTKVLEFEVPEWRWGPSNVAAADLSLELHAGPFSAALDGEGPLAVVRRPDDIGRVDSPGAVLLLCDEIAATQFTPRGYPFYSDPDHAGILDALEAARPRAIVAATTKSAMTGAMSPFPLIEEVGFGVPSSYMTAQDGARLAEKAGQTVSVHIDSEVRPSTSEQPIGRRAGTRDGRIIISAHIDSKPETPGAIDNAAGVAVMLAVAELLGGEEVALSVEYLPFNGEDHVLAPGEMAWLGANDDLSDVRLAINIDATGLLGGPSAYSLYGVDDSTTELVQQLAQSSTAVVEGPQWPASDHMIFAMRGVPAVALTSEDFSSASGDYSHTPADTPAILDYAVLADTARFVAKLIAGV